MPGRLDYKTTVASVYMISLFVQIMDATIVNIAIPTLAREFDTTRTAAGWAALSFVIALSAAIPAAGWLGDRFGLKRMFIAAMVGFTVASGACGAAQTLEQLVAFRAFQGAFSGIVTPIGAALLFKAYPLSERAEASRRIITVVVVAPALGPVLGGVLIDALNWRWIFFVNLPLGVIAIALAAYALVEDVHPDPGRLDIAGLLMSTAGLGLLIFGVTQGSEQGWTSAVVVGSLAAAGTLLGLLVITELHSTKPLLDLRLFRDRIFRAISVLALPTYAAFVSLLFLLPLFLDEAGHSPTRIGLTLLPQPVGVIVANQLTGRYLYKRFGPRGLLVAGTFSACVIGIVIARLGFDADLWAIRGLMFARGAAMGVIFIPVQTAVYAGIDRADTNRATALFSTARQFAPALGIAIVSTVLAGTIQLTDGSETNDLGVLELGYQRAMMASALMFALAFALTFLVHNSDAAETMRASD